MRYPLKNWNTVAKGYTFGVATFYSRHHLGIDHIVGSGTRIYAPTDGTARNLYGKEGGNTIHFWGEDGKLIRFMHLSRFGKKGSVKEGDVIGYTGSTGLSTGPHIHTDVSKSGTLRLNYKYFIDPDKYFKEGVEMKALKKKLAEMTQKYQTANHWNRTWRKRAEDAYKEIDELTEKIKALKNKTEKDLREVRGKLEELRAKNEELSKENEALNKELQKKIKELEKLKLPEGEVGSFLQKIIELIKVILRRK